MSEMMHNALRNSANRMAERKAILGRIQPKLIEFGLPVQDVLEVMTRLALTEITVLREIERDGLEELAGRLRERSAPQKEG